MAFLRVKITIFGQILPLRADNLVRGELELLLGHTISSILPSTPILIPRPENGSFLTAPQSEPPQNPEFVLNPVPRMAARPDILSRNSKSLTNDL